MRSVVVDPRILRPIPQELWGKVVCLKCRKSEARWDVTSDVRVPPFSCCSLCFLYEWEVVKSQASTVSALVAAVERELDTCFEKDLDGRLVKAADADRITFAIVTAAKMVYLRSRVT